MSHDENFSDVELIQYLQCEGFMENMITKLKATLSTQINNNKNPNSPLQLLKNAINILNLRIQPKGIKQIDLIQKFCQFLPPEECFETIALVCKEWNFAAKTIRLHSKICVYGLQEDCMVHFFYKSNPSNIFQALNTKLFSTIISHAQSLRMVDLCMISDPYLPETVSLVNSETNNLLSCESLNIENYSEMIQNSSNTLSFLIVNSESIEGIWNRKFPNLKYLSLGVDEEASANLIPFFENISENMEKIRDIELKDWTGNDLAFEQISDYVSNNLEKHCICGEHWWSAYFPLKMVTEIDFDNIWNFDTCHYKHKSKVQYADITTTLKSMKLKKLEAILSFYPNLKGICIGFIDRVTYAPTPTFHELLHEGKNETIKASLELSQKVGVPIMTEKQWNDVYKSLYEHTWELRFDRLT